MYIFLINIGEVIMKRKLIFVLLIAIVAFVGLSAISAVAENETVNEVNLTIVAQNPMTVSEMESAIKFNPEYKNYNYDVLSWLGEFDSNYVVVATGDYYVLMNASDANKLPGNINTGVSATSNVTCNVLENKSFGLGLNNIIYVEDVEVVSEGLENFVFGGNN